ncbi:hypothetical protein DL96DRAFT_1572298 [Flagelloscypha sp. PMI_526]|nr:hypothetical protein DL96DRAFT_1572298 [Flagelloscypha sp. PMI_526]
MVTSSTRSASRPSTSTSSAPLSTAPMFSQTSLTAGPSHVGSNNGSMSPYGDDMDALLGSPVSHDGVSHETFLTGSVEDGQVMDSPFGTPDQFFQSLAQPFNAWPTADVPTRPSTPDLSEFKLPNTLPIPPARSFNSLIAEAMFNDFVVQEPEAPELSPCDAFSSGHSSPVTDLNTPEHSPIMPSVEMPLVSDMAPQVLQLLLDALAQQAKVSQITASPTSLPTLSVPVVASGSSSSSSSSPTATYTRPVPPPRPTIPLDAPVQPRRYLAPSATSRKDSPPSLKRKAGEMDDADEMDEIAKKRLQNTMAARRSRDRKRNELKELRDTIAAVTAERDQAIHERDQWKEHALKMQDYARRLGAPLPEMPSI